MITSDHPTYTRQLTYNLDDRVLCGFVIGTIVARVGGEYLVDCGSDGSTWADADQLWLIR